MGSVKYIHMYGDDSLPKIILLAPMMVTGEELYQLISPYFKNEYCFISPDQGGHGKAGMYISADEEYASLREYLIDKHYTDIKLVYGASMGVALGYRLFTDHAFSVDKAWFDGVAYTKNAFIMDPMMRQLFRQRKRKLAKTKTDASQSLVKMYGYDFAKMMTKNFERITEEDIDHICYACCHYDIKSIPVSRQQKIHIEYGEYDPDYKISKMSLRKNLPFARLVIRKGYSHCGYMAANPKEYAEGIERFIR